MIKLSENFKEIENEVNGEIKRLEDLVRRQAKLARITSAGSKPQKSEEDRIFFHIDGTTRELIVRNQGQTFVVTLTKR